MRAVGGGVGNEPKTFSRLIKTQHIVWNRLYILHRISSLLSYKYKKCINTCDQNYFCKMVLSEWRWGGVWNAWFNYVWFSNLHWCLHSVIDNATIFPGWVPYPTPDLVAISVICSECLAPIKLVTCCCTYPGPCHQWLTCNNTRPDFSPFLPFDLLNGLWPSHRKSRLRLRLHCHHCEPHGSRL